MRWSFPFVGCRLRDALHFDKAVSKELASMATRLAHLDDTPAEPLSEEALRSLQGEPTIKEATCGMHGAAGERAQSVSPNLDL